MEAFAAAAAVGLYEAGKHLGCAPASWKGYATGTRPLPLYIERSLLAHLALAKTHPERFQSLIAAIDASTK